MAAQSRHSFRALLVIAAAVGAIILFLAPEDTAHATHRKFRQDNRTWINLTFGQTAQGLNSVNLWWAWYPNGTTKWWHDGSFQAAASDAVRNWSDSTFNPYAVSELAFLQVTNRADANLEVENGYCSSRYIPGCFFVLSYTPDWDRQADYVNKGLIHLDLDPTDFAWSDQAKVYGMNHELGHWIGLDEQYNEAGSGSCSSIVSAMNLLTSTTSTDGNCAHVEKPTAWDQGYAKLFWLGTDYDQQQSKMTNLFLNSAGWPSLSFTWKDGAWSDIYHWAELRYWNGVEWVQVPQSGRFHITGIGFRYPYENPPVLDRTMQESFSLTSPNYYRAYGTVFYGECWCWGPWTWSNCLYVDQESVFLC